MEKQEIVLEKILSLSIVDNQLEDLKGLEKFPNLRFIDLRRNKIKTISNNVVVFITNLIEKINNNSRNPYINWGENSFVLLLKGNNINKHSIEQVFQFRSLNKSFFPNDILHKSRSATTLLELENNLKTLVQKYNLSEYSKVLKRQFQNFSKFLQFLLDYNNYNKGQQFRLEPYFHYFQKLKRETFDNFHTYTNYVKFITDINPFTYNINSDFRSINFDIDWSWSKPPLTVPFTRNELNETLFLKDIPLPKIDYYINLLESSLNIELSLLLEFTRKKENIKKWWKLR